MLGTRCTRTSAALLALSLGSGCEAVDVASPDEPIAEPGQAELAQLDADDAESEFETSALVTAAACSGKPGRYKGKSRQTVQIGWGTREFVYYAPRDLDPNQPTPLVIVSHGFLMSGEEMYNMTGFKELADQEGFVAVFPDGGGLMPWNVGAGVNGWGFAVGATHDDQTFIDRIIDFVAADRCLDRDHVFAAGFSMGGYFSNELGCLRNDIAGIAPHSGGGHDLRRCRTQRKPVIIFHGTADWLIYYQNGVEMRDRWVQRNGCSRQTDKQRVKGGTCEWNRGCPEDGQVVLCSFDGLTHSWAGGNRLTSLFTDPNREPAARLAWDFWKNYAW
jgi:polyhydroxybutyrate depolymerase